MVDAVNSGRHLLYPEGGCRAADFTTSSDPELSMSRSHRFDRPVPSLLARDYFDGNHLHRREIWQDEYRDNRANYCTTR